MSPLHVQYASSGTPSSRYSLSGISGEYPGFPDVLLSRQTPEKSADFGGSGQAMHASLECFFPGLVTFPHAILLMWGEYQHYRTAKGLSGWTGCPLHQEYRPFFISRDDPGNSPEQLLYVTTALLNRHQASTNMMPVNSMSPRYARSMSDCMYW